MNIFADVKGKNYVELIDYANELCDEFSFVSNIILEDSSQTMKEILEELSPFLLQIIPGGDLNIEHLSWNGLPVFYYKLNEVTAYILKKHSNSLYSWLFPVLPKDLSFYKLGRIPWLINISHEQETYSYCITDEEIQELSKIEGLKVL